MFRSLIRFAISLLGYSDSPVYAVSYSPYRGKKNSEFPAESSAASYWATGPPFYLK